jgi:hypothetical protein
MTSKIKVDNIENQCGGAVVTKCGGTTTISGSVVKSNAIQASDGGNLVSQSGTTITLGASGDTINLASGASQSGFGRTGTVDWQTTPKTATFTAVSGEGYFANTTGSAFNMNLPAGSAGAIVSVADYAATWQTNNLTVVPNGTDKIGGVASTSIALNTEGQSVTLVYVDSTQGWINTMDSTSNVRALTQYNVQYLVVAGGGGGGTNYGGGGGAGGYRTLAGKTFSVASETSFPITVGAGGAGAPNPASPEVGVSGSNSIFSTITSAGGGGGGGQGTVGVDGGSGGGGSRGPGGTGRCSGAGNTPPVSPSQGNAGAPVPSMVTGTGGGGGGAAGTGSAKTAGVGSSFADLGPLAPSYGTTGPAPGRYFSGGGGGYVNGAGGAGGGGTAPNSAATVNTGGGGSACAAGGSGIVIIRYVTADASPSVSGGNATTTCGSDTIRVFTGPGTFVS